MCLGRVFLAFKESVGFWFNHITMENVLQPHWHLKLMGHKLLRLKVYYLLLPLICIRFESQKYLLDDTCYFYEIFSPFCLRQVCLET